MKENMTSKDVRFHHRICDAQKHIVQGTEKFINFSKNQGNFFRIGVGGHKGLADVKANRILSMCKTCR